MLLKVCHTLKMKNKKSLADLLPSERGSVSELTCKGGIRRRFQDIGLIPGTVVICVGRSPLGDPSAYYIRGKIMAIRREDAKLIKL